ncbi:MAG: hypothetical protein QXS21_05925 [Thermoproteota archaeon]
MMRMSLVDFLTKSIMNGLKDAGVNAEVGVVGNEVVIKIGKDEVKDRIVKAFPENVRRFVSVDSGDIVIRIQFSMVM